jgi:hypothetical protein
MAPAMWVSSPAVRHAQDALPRARGVVQSAVHQHLVALAGDGRHVAEVATRWLSAGVPKFNPAARMVSIRPPVSM